MAKARPPRTIIPSTAFRQDVKRLARRGSDRNKLRAVLDLLTARLPLEVAHRDHALRGIWKGWRDLHIEPDWLLVYRVKSNNLELARTGTHADLFE